MSIARSRNSTIRRRTLLAPISQTKFQSNSKFNEKLFNALVYNILLCRCDRLTSFWTTTLQSFHYYNTMHVLATLKSSRTHPYVIYHKVQGKCHLVQRQKPPWSQDESLESRLGRAHQEIVDAEKTTGRACRCFDASKFFRQSLSSSANDEMCFRKCILLFN